MGWKDWPYWFKGGIISLVIPIVFFIYAIINVETGFENFAYLFTIEIAVVAFIIGSIIGLIIGKARQK